MDKLKTIGKPIAGVKAIHSHAAAAAAKPEDAGGLESLYYILQKVQCHAMYGKRLDCATVHLVQLSVIFIPDWTCNT